MKTIENEKLDAAIVDFFAKHKKAQVQTDLIVQRFAAGESSLERARIYERLRGLVRAGAIRRIKKGVYQYCKPLAQPGTGSTKQEVMWRLIRARRTVTLDDLVELADVPRTTASVFCGNLVRNDVARKVSAGKYQLIKDPVAMPRDEKTTERKRSARKAAAIAALENAQAALAQAKTAINEMED